MRGSFRKFCGNLKCAEIGVKAGVNALHMLQKLPFAQLVLVDSYDVNNPTFQDNGEIYTPEQRTIFIAKMKEKLNPFDNRITLIIEDSVVASRRFSDNHFDYIYIDAEHDYESVARDLRAWWPKLKIGGTMGGHDVGLADIMRALRKFFGEGNWLVEEDDWYKVKQ